MSTQTDATRADAAREIDDALDRLERTIGRLQDGELHLAHRDGGWTVAQCVSHINVCTIIWLGDLQRLRDDPELAFFFREEIGHDLMGYPPPTVDRAVGQLRSTRRSLECALRALDPALLERRVEIPDLGTMTIGEWTPAITGHLVMHVGQALDVLRDRDALPAEA